MSVFHEIPEDRVIYKDEMFFIIRDKYPVSDGHSLIISNMLRSDYFDLTEDEKLHLVKVIEKCKKLIEQEFIPDGYNIGMNCGEVAGQTVMHFHCHLIPRYKGDMEDPRGGVRHCVAGKGYY
ncbi:HIT family protein [Pontibacter toksunensis]|uniref:HIT family protein n=1 Tax=Pontibacter toksunensis TaxID=1332631 RepID=A0ABW6BRQ4_9BACT